MSPVRVIPPLDEVEDGHPGLGLDREATAVQQLALEGGEEALTKGAVVRVPPHGRADADLAAAEPNASGWV